jgi:hypothetical protein
MNGGREGESTAFKCWESVHSQSVGLSILRVRGPAKGAENGIEHRATRRNLLLLHHLVCVLLMVENTDLRRDFGFHVDVESNVKRVRWGGRFDRNASRCYRSINPRGSGDVVCLWSSSVTGVGQVLAKMMCLIWFQWALPISARSDDIPLGFVRKSTLRKTIRGDEISVE